MSSYGPDVADETIAILQSSWVGSCCIVAGSTLVFYDHARTLQKEYQFIWGRKLSIVTIIFQLNRWTTLAWAVINLFGSFHPLITLSSCLSAYVVSYVNAIILWIVWAVFSAVRVYAISGGKWWLAVVVCALSLVPAATNAYQDFGASWYQIDTLPLMGTVCVSGFNTSPGSLLGYILGTRICVIVADTIVLLVTIFTTYGMKKDADRNNMTTPLATLLLKDGTLHFLVLILLSILNIVGDLTNIFSDMIYNFSTPLQSIIITHFLLGLRRTASASEIDSMDHSQTSSHRSSLKFTSFVDNMGEQLMKDLEDSESGCEGASVYSDTTVEAKDIEELSATGIRIDVDG